MRTPGRRHSPGTRRRRAALSFGAALVTAVGLALAGCALPPAPAMTPQAECARSGGTWMATSCEHSAGGGGGAGM
jgi:hypothetical protein